MISGKHIVLRRVEPSDYPSIMRWQNDPEVFRRMDYERPFSAADIVESETRAAAEGVPFIIEADGEAIGRIGLNKFHPRDRLCGLYLFLGESSARGKGYALDAVLTVLGYAFDVLDVRMVELWALSDNLSALHVYKKAGFVEDARLPERSFAEGRYLDHVVMHVDRDAYEAARASWN